MTTKPIQADLDLYAAAYSASEMVGLFGFVCTLTPELVTLTLPTVGARHRGGLGSEAVNGGVLAAMYDYALGNVAMLVSPLRRFATVQLSTTFERAVTGSSIRCEAVLDRAASNVVFGSARIFDGNGTVCSRATGIVSLGKAIELADWVAAIGASHA